MTDDRKEALDELEKELLNDDLLSDMPESLINTDVWNWDEEKDFPVNAFSFDNDEAELSVEEPLSEDSQINHEEVEDNRMQRKTRKQAAQQQEDSWQIILMAIASFLCLGIIGVMIYWLETFL